MEYDPPIEAGVHRIRAVLTKGAAWRDTSRAPPVFQVDALVAGTS